MSANCYAIIAAAGMGSRMGLGYNKAYMPLNGQPVLLRAMPLSKTVLRMRWTC